MEQVTKSEKIYSGKVVNLRVDTVRFDNGDTGIREVVEHNGAVAMVAMPDESHVYLVSQYRTAAGKTLLEIPAGTLKTDEEPEACAHRELTEEIHYRAAKMQRLCGFYTAPGFSQEFLTVFLATDLSPEEGQRDEDEFIDVKLVEFSDALHMIQTGEIEDAKSIAGLLAAARLQGR